MRISAVTVLALLLLARTAGAEEKLVTMDFVDAPLTKVVKYIEASCDVMIEVSPGLSRAKVTLEVEDAKVADVLGKLAKLAAEDGEAVKRDDGSWRLRRKGEDDPPEVKIKRALDTTRVNINFQDTSIRDAFNFLGRYGDVGIVVDPEVFRKKSDDELLVNLQADDITLGNALDLIVLTKGLAKEIRWGVVFVSTEDRLSDLPKEVLPVVSKDAEDWELALRKRLTERITFSFDGATIQEALDFVRTLKSLNVVVAPDARPAAEEADLTLSVTNVSIADALSLMLLPRGFTWRLEEGVVLVVPR